MAPVILRCVVIVLLQARMALQWIVNAFQSIVNDMRRVANWLGWNPSVLRRVAVVALQVVLTLRCVTMSGRLSRFALDCGDRKSQIKFSFLL